MILPPPRFSSLQNFLASCPQACLKLFAFALALAFAFTMLSLQAGDNSLECCLRHFATRPPPGCIPWQSLAASSAHGFAFCAADAPVAIATQNTPASTANHFI